MLETFYSTVAQLCFVLLGLWWVVVQFKFETWKGDRRRRRTSRHVSLYFLLPGIMSLFALLSSRVTVLWRIGFGVMAAIGVIEAVLALTGRDRETRPSRQIVTVLTGLLFLAIAIFALAPSLATGLPGDLRPIEVEGILVSVLLFVGTTYAWAMFVEEETTTTAA
jgi:hypothetical protein